MSKQHIKSENWKKIGSHCYRRERFFVENDTTENMEIQSLEKIQKFKRQVNGSKKKYNKQSHDSSLDHPNFVVIYGCGYEM